MPQYFSIRGRDHGEAIDRIKKKYGDRARILMHKSVPSPGIMGLFGREQVEYTGYIATGDEARVVQKSVDDENRKAILTAAGIKVPPSAAGPVREAPEVPDDRDSDAQFGEVLREIRNLKGQLAIAASAPPADPFPVLAEISRILADNDFDREYIDEILDSLRRDYRAAELGDRPAMHQSAAKLIAESVTYFLPEQAEGPRIFILVGPTGVGKTTTIAKLAAVHGLSGGSNTDVRIITVDSFRIGARAQVETYGEIMGIPVKAVDDYDELKRQIAFASDADLILVDTIGKSPKDTVKIEDMRQLLLACGKKSEIHLAVSATTKTTDLKEIMEQFQSFEYQSVVLTKLDETSRIGNLISVASAARVPLSYFTDGQSVPVDIAVASPIRLLSRLKGLEYDEADLIQHYPAADLAAAWR
jgi:flagellar biosynthesis protein FlhF